MPPSSSRNCWLPAVSMWLVSLISYIDRTTLAILAPAILRDTHLSAEQYGLIISCFSVAYMLGNPLWGIALDRIGVSRGMTAAVAIWSLASAAHAFASGFWTFGLARAVLGAGEGATFPGGLRTVTQTLPPEKQGKGLAIAYSGGSLGAMVTPLIVTPIALWFGWHGAFLFTGLVGAAWLIFWHATASGIDRTATAAPSNRSLPLRRIWTQPALWAYMAAYGIASTPLGFILYDASLYLHARFGWSQATLGKVLWIPPLGWEVGYFVWGALLDRLGPRFRTLMFIALLFTLPLAAMHWLPTAPFVLLDMFVSMFGLGGFVVLSVGYATRAFPKDRSGNDRSGFLAGAGAGSWGAMVALTSPLFGRMFDQAAYSTAFVAATLFTVAGYVLWLILDAFSPAILIKVSSYDDVVCHPNQL